MKRLGIVLALVGCARSQGGTGQVGSLLVSHAVVAAPISRRDASAFLVIDNRGDASAALSGVRSPAADSVLMHDVSLSGMRRVDRIAVPAKGRTLLVPGRFHLMMMGLKRDLSPGDTVVLELTLDPGGVLAVHAPVRTYTDAISELPQK